MIELEIRAVFCAELLVDVGESDGWERLDLWQPEDRRFLRLSLTLEIGPKGSTGTNSFWLEICTKEFARKEGTNKKKKYVLLVDEFDWLKIKLQIIERVRSCERDNWDKSVAELRKHFVWEYETKQTTRKKLEPLPKGVFLEPDWDDEEPDQ